MPILLLKERKDAGTIDAEGQEILDLLAGERDDAQVERSVQLLRGHGVMDDVRQLAHDWSEDAVASLEVIPDGEVKDGLIAFARLMVDRIS